MKKPIKKAIIITAVTLAVIIGLGTVFAFIQLGGVRQYRDFHTATIITQGRTVGGQNDIRLYNKEGLSETSPDQYDFYNRLIHDIGRTRFSLLTGLLEFSLGSHISIPDADRRLSVADIRNLTPGEGEFLLKLEFDEPRLLPRALWLLDELAPCYCEHMPADFDYRTKYDTIVLRVVDSANEITRIDAYAFLNSHMIRVNNYDDCSPLHYHIVPMRIRLAPTRLFRTMEGIVDDWARMPLPRP